MAVHILNQSEKINAYPYEAQPCAEFKFFVYDPIGDGLMYYKSAEDCDRAASALIQQFTDSDDVVVGIVSHVVKNGTLHKL